MIMCMIILMLILFKELSGWGCAMDSKTQTTTHGSASSGAVTYVTNNYNGFDYSFVLLSIFLNIGQAIVLVLIARYFLVNNTYYKALLEWWNGTKAVEEAAAEKAAAEKAAAEKAAAEKAAAEEAAEKAAAEKAAAEKAAVKEAAEEAAEKAAAEEAAEKAAAEEAAEKAAAEEAKQEAVSCNIPPSHDINHDDNPVVKQEDTLVVGIDIVDVVDNNHKKCCSPLLKAAGGGGNKIANSKSSVCQECADSNHEVQLYEGGVYLCRNCAPNK